MITQEKRNAKELRELERRRRQRDRKPYAGYLLVLCVIVVLIHVVDEVTTNLSSMVQSSVVTEFFVTGKGMTYNEGLATMSAASSFVYVVALIGPFYKSLADRLGRKLFLVLNTFGFALGLMLCYLANNYVVYLMGTIAIAFFTAHDLQVVFIMETAPKEKRATIYGLTKCLGTIGLVLVPVMRRIFLDADATNWRPMFALPAVAAIVVAVMAMVFVRETPAFVKSRVEYLEQPYDVRHPAKFKRNKTEKQSEKEETRKAGVFPAFRHLLTNKTDLRWLALAYMALTAGQLAISSYNESIMASGGMTTAEITNAQFVYSFGFAAIILLGGLIGDRFGRRMTALCSGGLSLVSFCLFSFAASRGWNAYVIGVLYSCSLGGYWTCLDYLALMVSEKVPTDVRISTLAALGLLQMVSVIVGTIALTVLLAVFKNAFVGSLCTLVAVPAIGACVLLTVFKVSETKGVAMDEIN